MTELDKKEIQEQRMKGYFIQATKEMLKGEGLKSLSVRKIADRAGYSYATMYHYFKDVQELIFVCVQDFQDECRDMVEAGTKGLLPGKEKISAKVSLYIQFFIDYPGIFELFYLEKMNDIERKQPVSALIYTFLTRLCQPEWEYCINQGVFSRDEALARQKELNYAVTGMMLHYLNRRQPADYKDFSSISLSLVERLLR